MYKAINYRSCTDEELEVFMNARLKREREFTGRDGIASVIICMDEMLEKLYNAGYDVAKDRSERLPDALYWAGVLHEHLIGSGLTGISDAFENYIEKHETDKEHPMPSADEIEREVEMLGYDPIYEKKRRERSGVID